MTEAPARVAVQAGVGGARVAAVDPGGRPYLLAEVTGDVPPAELLGAWAGELVVVRDCRRPGCPVPREWAGRATAVVAAGVAAGRGVGRSAVGRGLLVVDAGHGGTTLTLLDAADRVVSVRRCAVGGSALDAAVAGLPGVPAGRARGVREELSLAVEVPGVGAEAVRGVLAPLLDRIVAAAGELVAGTPVDVLLVGGVARTPLLAELFDEAVLGPVTVAARPETAAVLGALMPPAPAPAGAVPPAPAPAGAVPAVECLPECPVPGPCEGPVEAAPAPGSAGDAPVLGSAAGAADAGESASGRRWLPSPPRRAPAAPAALAALLAAASAALLVAGPSPPPPDPGGLVVQYGYAMRLPEGWAHTGGLPERRRTLLTPAGAPEGSDLVAVERTPLGYDATAEPDRAISDLRAAFDAAVSAGVALSDFATSTGRAAARYRQHGAGGVIDWYVVLDGPDQLSVGCQRTHAGAADVERACAVVIGSVRRSP